MLLEELQSELVLLLLIKLLELLLQNSSYNEHSSAPRVFMAVQTGMWQSFCIFTVKLPIYLMTENALNWSCFD